MKVGAQLERCPSILATFVITSPGLARTLADHFHGLFFVEPSTYLENFHRFVQPLSWSTHYCHLEISMGLSNLPRPQRQASRKGVTLPYLGFGLHYMVQVQGALVQNTLSCDIFSGSRLDRNLKIRFSNQQYFLEWGLWRLVMKVFTSNLGRWVLFLSPPPLQLSPVICAGQSILLANTLL